MPRAHRYYLPGHIWHITHRCHNKSFFLKNEGFRNRWVYWLSEAKRRFGLVVLDYTVTCNHIHLITFSDHERYRIPNSMQLIEGRVAQEFNEMESRHGAFWEDRYHATAVDTRHHLLRCICYIDLNMVRAGAVSHPQAWLHGGYRELQQPKQRYRLIDHDKLCALTDISDTAVLLRVHKEMVENALRNGMLQRDECWTKSIAVGSEKFVKDFFKKLGPRSKRKIYSQQAAESNVCMVREEPAAAYGQSGPNSGELSYESVEKNNMIPWDLGLPL